MVKMPGLEPAGPEFDIIRRLSLMKICTSYWMCTKRFYRELYNSLYIVLSYIVLFYKRGIIVLCTICAIMLPFTNVAFYF